MHIFNKTNIPVVFDFHNYNCNNSISLDIRYVKKYICLCKNQVYIA